MFEKGSIPLGEIASLFGNGYSFLIFCIYYLPIYRTLFQLDEYLAYKY